MYSPPCDTLYILYCTPSLAIGLPHILTSWLLYHLYIYTIASFRNYIPYFLSVYSPSFTDLMEGGGWMLLLKTSVFSMCPADLLKAQQYMMVLPQISPDMVSVHVEAVIT